MTQPLVGELACRVHIAAVVTEFMKDGSAILMIREIDMTDRRYQCSCMLIAEFYVENYASDQALPLFSEIEKKET